MGDQFPIIVIGGGAAGMIAAWRAGSLGAKVLLLEKNSRLGIKLLISGGGKCNITHRGDIESLRLQFRTNEARFLKHSFHEFTNSDIIALLNERGVATYERENGKIFPLSHKAGDVVHALRRMMESAGVGIKLSSAVQEILHDEHGISGVNVNGVILPSRNIIVAAGGSSYAKTGTTGDGFRWAESLGHTIVPLRPALAPIYLSPLPPVEWQGIALRDCVLKAEAQKRTIAHWRGDLLFTHIGISGPAALEVSRDAYIAFESGAEVTLAVDCVPEKSSEQLEKEFLEQTTENGTRQVETIVVQSVPQRLAPYVAHAAGVESDRKLHQLRKKERQVIARTLKHWCIGTIKEIPLDRGEVTAGGVSLKEIDPRTMRSRIINGLFLCGEVLDIAGPVGGYNLQAAFSTGYVAGETAAKQQSSTNITQ
jgi:predicted Rossmann fold flavoprotein